jgi:hypothetical protein
MTRITTTKKQLDKLIHAFYQSIDPDASAVEFDTFKSNIFVAGGAITSLLANEKPNDVDIYFRDVDYAKYFITGALRNHIRRVTTSATRAVVDRVLTNTSSREYVNETHTVSLDAEAADIESLNTHIKGVGTIKLKHLTRNALSFSGLAEKIPFQIIMRFVGEPEDVLTCFDFAHTKNFYLPGQALYLSPRSLLSQTSKELKYEGSFFPFTSIIRTKKFMARGWSCSGGEYLKMVLQLAKLDWSNPEVLRDQLQGVDTIYFQDLLARLPEGGVVNEEELLKQLESAFA